MRWAHPFHAWLSRRPMQPAHSQQPRVALPAVRLAVPTAGLVLHATCICPACARAASATARGWRCTCWPRSTRCCFNKFGTAGSDKHLCPRLQRPPARTCDPPALPPILGGEGSHAGNIIGLVCTHRAQSAAKRPCVSSLKTSLSGMVRQSHDHACAPPTGACKHGLCLPCPTGQRSDTHSRRSLASTARCQKSKPHTCGYRTATGLFAFNQRSRMAEILKSQAAAWR